VAELHNRVHVWVGGDMEPPTSPNDPVFYLNHCNVDRVWASWQQHHPSAGYLPATGDQTLAFHRRDDPMFRPFWWGDNDPQVRPRDMLEVADRYTLRRIVRRGAHVHRCGAPRPAGFCERVESDGGHLRAVDR
jgi:Common central domain of tyrosinase